MPNGTAREKDAGTDTPAARDGRTEAASVDQAAEPEVGGLVSGGGEAGAPASAAESAGPADEAADAGRVVEPVAGGGESDPERGGLGGGVAGSAAGGGELDLERGGLGGEPAEPVAGGGQAESAATHHGLGIEEALHEVEAVEHEYRPPAAGVVSNLVTAAAVVVLGVAALLGSWALGVGRAKEPGPGTWPLLVSVLLVVLGVALLLNFRRVSDAEKFSGSSWLVLGGLATMVVFVGVIDVIGFEIPSALLCFVWLRYLGREGWRMSIITSLGVVVGFYLVFVAALAVPIPHLF